MNPLSPFAGQRKSEKTKPSQTPPPPQVITPLLLVVRASFLLEAIFELLLFKVWSNLSVHLDLTPGALREG